MFEQATLNNGPAGKRLWTTLLGVTSQATLISIAVLAPMVFPQVLPLARLDVTLAPPVPPGPQKLGKEDVKQRPARASNTRPPAWTDVWVAPTRVPDHVQILTDLDEPRRPSVMGSLGTGPGQAGVPGGMDAFLAGVARDVVPPPPLVRTKPPVEVVAPEPTKRYTVGGNVQLGALLHKGEPRYPDMAKATRTQGDVKLECVVGTDGHIKEVKVLSGSPLLYKAAVEAAWQFVYAPSQLNGSPIEIITILTFNFKLN